MSDAEAGEGGRENNNKKRKIIKESNAE